MEFGLTPMDLDRMMKEALAKSEEGPYKVVWQEHDEKPWYVKSKHGLPMGRFKDKADAEAHAKRLDKVLNSE